MSANATYNENAVVGTYCVNEFFGTLLDHRYSFNTANDATSGTTANKPVYIVGTIGNDGLFYLANKWWAQDLPTTEDGLLYMYIGDPYDYYRMEFALNHTIYWYKNGAIRQFTQDALTVNGHTVAKDVPSNAVFSYSAGTGLSLSGTEFSVKTGYTTSGNNRKVQADSNGNLYVTQKDDNTTYTFANGTNGFTVTPLGGTAQTVTVTPSITNNITGSGTSGYLTKFNGANTITNGPQLGSSTTTYLNNAGSWATPPDTKNTAGSTDTSSKIYLIGATSQAANPQTYSDNEVYVTSGVLTTKSVQIGGGSCTLQYNSTTASCDFVFT